MGAELKLFQTQKLIMTPELKQSLKLLQYTSYELKDFVENELLNNPILQKYDENICDTDNIDWKSLSEDLSYNKTYCSNCESKEYLEAANFIPIEQSLYDYLKAQLHLLDLSDEEIKTGTYLIENIDENGYIDLTDEEMINPIFIKMLPIIQEFDPVGVGARNLQECLMIQLKKISEFDDVELEQNIIDNYMDYLANNQLDKIATMLNESCENIQCACDRIKSLEPKPARAFSSLREVKYITPDVYIQKIGDSYSVMINESTSPRLYISKYYTNLLNSKSTSSSVNEYIQGKLKAGLQIMRSIEERRLTIQKVAEQILKLQYGFFENGEMYLKPMTLKDVASEVDLHESTVCRAINGKYLQCSRGIFSMKHFFQSGVKDVCGQGISAQSVKMLLKDIISGENRKKPLSDQKISNIFIRSGVKISRRTIAKYRESMGIPATSKRKVY